MKDLLEIAFKAIDDKQGEDIVVIDLRSINPFIDYFIIASANNNRKAVAIIDEISDRANIAGYTTKTAHYKYDTKWFICDLNSIVCHIFVGDEREKYNLEGLWKDLPTIKL